MNPTRAEQLEAAQRKPSCHIDGKIGIVFADGALHYLPYPAGQAVPRFENGRLIGFGAEQALPPGADELRGRIVTGAREIQRSANVFLVAPELAADLVQLAALLIRAGYDVSDAALSAKLRFGRDPAGRQHEWVGKMLTWCAGGEEPLVLVRAGAEAKANG